MGQNQEVRLTIEDIINRIMIDFHSHVLPFVDDGSRNIEESKELLKKLGEQRITTVVATPHFMADSESIQNFIEKRDEAFFMLDESISEEAPEIKLGAEISYYYGISRMKDLEKLVIGDSKLLLLEMPMIKWSSTMLGELFYLSSDVGIKPVLAHVERYLSFQEKDVLKKLFDEGVLIQSNASFFNCIFTQRKALKLLAAGKIQLIGSDCHNLDSRPPDIGKAYSTIEKRLGKDFFNQMNTYSEDLLRGRLL